MLHYKEYRTNENDEWVVLLHGLGGNSSIWFRQKRAFSKQFNILFIDLHGHGESAISIHEFQNYSIEDVAKDVLRVLDALNIEKAAFMGVSLGTVIARAIALIAPERVRFLVMVGAVLNFNVKAKFLLHMGDLLKNFIPYLSIYKLFAWIIMPKKNHSESRKIFIQEAVKLGRQEFLIWYKLAREVGKLYSKVRLKNLSIPTKYIMGSEDHMFIDLVKEETKFTNQVLLHVIEKSGHLCNIENYKEFNQVAIEYISTQFSGRNQSINEQLN